MLNEFKKFKLDGLLYSGDKPVLLLLFSAECGHASLWLLVTAYKLYIITARRHILSRLVCGTYKSQPFCPKFCKSKIQCTLPREFQSEIN